MIDYIDQIASTNTYLMQRLASGEALPHLYTLCTFCQTKGRGQRGNGWESEPGKNLSFTTVFDTASWRPEQLRLLSLMVPLAVAEALEPIMQQRVEIKWPNDLYVGDKKLCGILIENVLQSNRICYSIAGVGINVNQLVFLSDAPNPTSMCLLTGKEYDLKEVMAAVQKQLEVRWQHSETDVRSAYMARLYRREGWWLWREVPVTGAPIAISYETTDAFRARIADVNQEGALVLAREDGSEKTYQFKEIKYIL